jgi:hypothetical protein
MLAPSNKFDAAEWAAEHHGTHQGHPPEQRVASAAVGEHHGIKNARGEMAFQKIANDISH